MHDYCRSVGTKKLRLRDWLKQKLDNNEVEGVEWIDRSRGVFKIPWIHGSHHHWCFKTAPEIFKQWAIYTGKYKFWQPPDPGKWKTNFRCALNALPDFREIRDKSCPRGPKAYKIYVMKCNDSRVEKKASGEKPTPQSFDLMDREIVQLIDDMMRPSPVSVEKQAVVPRRPISAFPAFETLVIDRSRENFPYSTFYAMPWFLAAWNAMAVDQFVQKPASKTDNVDDGSDDKVDDDENVSDKTPEKPEEETRD